MTQALITAILHGLEEGKAQDIVDIDVSEHTSITDHMIICQGTSSRHVLSISQHVLDAIKAKGFEPLGVEGQGAAEWVLVDAGDAIVHVMLPDTRHFYELEKLWNTETAIAEDS